MNPLSILEKLRAHLHVIDPCEEAMNLRWAETCEKRVKQQMLIGRIWETAGRTKLDLDLRCVPMCDERRVLAIDPSDYKAAQELGIDMIYGLKITTHQQPEDQT